MRKVVTDPAGTASVVSGSGVAVAGKTGTAQVSGAQSHGWFTGFFPFESPRFVICVFLENGVSGYNASLAARDIIARMREDGLTG
jgi:cell division protein FtsI/penicillin-binding protein 2